ncbi:MAG: flagellar motor protein MotB [Candidatus Omnitrophota bacterium]
MKFRIIKAVLIIFVTLSMAGCTFIFQKGRRSDMDKIKELSRQVDELSQAKKILEERFGQEIADRQVKLEMQDKGLVITVVGDLLFDSGKATIRHEAYPVMDKVGLFLKENVPNLNVAIEGHTDNQPIQHSGWKSNWELSTARALSVLHYLVNEENILPERLSAIGYGEYRPVASNDTREGTQLNRRVEIVIMPKLAKVKGKEEILLEPQENLK